MPKLKIKGTFGKKGGHTYANPNVRPTVVIGKEGKPIIRLKRIYEKLENGFEFVNLNQLKQYRNISFRDLISGSSKVIYIGKDKLIEAINIYSGLSYTQINAVYALLVLNNRRQIKQGLDDISFNSIQKHYIHFLRELNTLFKNFIPNDSTPTPIYRGIILFDLNRSMQKKKHVKIDDMLKPRLKQAYGQILQLLRADKGDILELFEPSPTSWSYNPKVAYDFAIDFGTDFKAFDDRLLLRPEMYYQEVRKDPSRTGIMIKLTNNDDLNIERPEGYFVARISEYPAEEELLLPPLRGNFVVEDVKYSKYYIGKYEDLYRYVKEITLKPVKEPEYIINFGEITI